MAGETYVVGAGLAGLAAAVALAGAGRRVMLFESGVAAGGRCRSYHDRELGCRIDNGNHLLLSGNRAAVGFLATIGAAETLTGPARPTFPFFDIPTRQRWTVAPNAGRLPWWVLRPLRRVPGTRAKDYVRLLALRRVRPAATVAALLDDGGALYRLLLEPLAIAALNTPADEALAVLLSRVVAETLMRGGVACRPLVPRVGLSESFIDPAVAWLTARGAPVFTGRRIVALRVEAERVVALESPDGPVEVGPADSVVLATPAPVAADLLPRLIVPDTFNAILNIHFRTEAEPGAAGFVGLVGGTAEWVFVKPGIVSVTISAANRLIDLPAQDIATRVWPDVATALSLDRPMPPWRVVKERRATIAATAAQEAKRPSARIGLRNLALAGDWTNTGLPGTIEGAVRSGRVAADVLLNA
jgi:squalene-associated FAD-dependent desaturase